jgi:hypothetical protein
MGYKQSILFICLWGPLGQCLYYAPSEYEENDGAIFLQFPPPPSLLLQKCIRTKMSSSAQRNGIVGRDYGGGGKRAHC